MYDLIDRPVGDLPPFERALLLALRRWAHAMTMAGRAPADLDGTPFADAMTLLHDASVMTLVIRAPCVAAVDDSEALILNLWRLVRDGAVGPATRIADAIVGDAARAMVGAIERAVQFA